jgi:predicted nucleotidyltransferase
VPLSPAEFREHLTRRFAATYEQDERIAADLRARLPEAVRLIVELLGPRRILLYGSLATGLFLAAHSDVDLAVEGMGQPPEELVEALRRLFGRRVDVVDPALVAAHVRRDIARRGLVIHEPAGEGRGLGR